MKVNSSGPVALAAILAGALAVSAAVVLPSLIASRGAARIVAYRIADEARVTIRVPSVNGRSLPAAYAELHRDRLRVTVPRSYAIDWSGECVPLVTESGPAAGRPARRGVPIVLQTRIPLCAAASPANPDPLPRARIPSFAGRRLPVAIGWVRRHHLLWSARFPALQRADAATLDSNYSITSQTPAAGTVLTTGVTTADGGWLPTPLHLTLRQSVQYRP